MNPQTNALTAPQHFYMTLEEAGRYLLGKLVQNGSLPADPKADLSDVRFYSLDLDDIVDLVDSTESWDMRYW